MNAKRLYQHGNGEGRITCDDYRCAGMTASGSGMRYDLHHAPILPITMRDVREWDAAGLGHLLRCEGCNAAPALIHGSQVRA